MLDCAVPQPLCQIVFVLTRFNLRRDQTTLLRVGVIHFIIIRSWYRWIRFILSLEKEEWKRNLTSIKSFIHAIQKWRNVASNQMIHLLLKVFIVCFLQICPNGIKLCLIYSVWNFKQWFLQKETLIFFKFLNACCFEGILCLVSARIIKVSFLPILKFSIELIVYLKNKAIKNNSSKELTWI
jgi:hypothetical protein